MSDIKLKLKKMAEITLEDGSTVLCEYIGRGRYTTAWRNSHRVYLQTHEKDNSKDILVRLSRPNSGTRNKHIPDVERHGWFAGDKPYRLYSAPLYSRLLAKHRRAWEDFKLLSELREQAYTETTNQRIRERWDAVQTAQRANQLLEDKVRDATYISEELKEAITDLVYQCSLYDGYAIEITKKNCAVDADGTLILLDPCFDLVEVWNAVDAARKRNRGY